MATNVWRIIAEFYLGCHIIGVTPTSRLFRNFFFLKTREEFYFLQFRGKPIVNGLPDTNKGWKPLFLRITSPIGFEVDLQWRVAKVGGNKAPTLTLVEQKDYSKILDHESGFPWTLVKIRMKLKNTNRVRCFRMPNHQLLCRLAPNSRLMSPVGLVSLLTVLFKL